MAQVCSWGPGAGAAWSQMHHPPPPILLQLCHCGSSSQDFQQHVLMFLHLMSLRMLERVCRRDRQTVGGCKRGWGGGTKSQWLAVSLGHTGNWLWVPQREVHVLICHLPFVLHPNIHALRVADAVTLHLHISHTDQQTKLSERHIWS